MENLLTVQEAGQRLHLAPEVLRRMIRQGVIAAVRLGPRRIRISEAELEAFVKRHVVGSDEGSGT